MTENNENGGTKKCNLADLSKIPATEFEKHFHEWMERDDVARGLQAKLRCDLIKNFNKTNLGKTFANMEKEYKIPRANSNICGGGDGGRL